MPNLSDLELLQKLNADQGFFNFTPEEMKRFESMPESKQIKAQMKSGIQAREEGFKSARDAGDWRANKNLHKDHWKSALADTLKAKKKKISADSLKKGTALDPGYASRVQGKDATGEYLSPEERKQQFKKQKAVSFVNGKSDETKTGGEKKQTQVGVPKEGLIPKDSEIKGVPQEGLIPKDSEGKGEGKGEEKAEQASNNIEDLKKILVPNFTKIEGHLQSILDTFEDESKLDKKQDRKDDILEEKGAKKGREEELEGKGSKPKIVDKALKAVKPAKGLFDMILGFVKNVLMGAALLGLVNILQNPQKILKPIIGVVNGIVGFLNQVLKVLFGTILMPINALISGFNLGFKAIFGAINTVLGWFKQKPLEPWKIDRLEPPQIPTIPLPGEPKQEAPPVQKAQGGGEIQGDAPPPPSPGGEENDINLEEESSKVGSELDESVSATEANLEKQVQELDKLLTQVPSDESMDVGPSPSGGGETPTPSAAPTGGGGETPTPSAAPTGEGDKGVVKGIQSAMGGGIVQRMKGGGSVVNNTNNIQRMKGGGNVTNQNIEANQISAAEGGPVESNSGVSVSGLGPDTQLVAAQPGEVVMSKKAVDMIGADKLLALNKEAGGTNKPAADTLGGVKVSKMSGGGPVGGSRARVGGSSGSRGIPGSPSSRNTRVRVIPIVPKQKSAAGSAASADQKQVNSFSASDVNNYDLNVVKSIYNIVG